LDLVEVAGHPIQIVDKAEIAVEDWSYIDDSLWNTSYGNTAVKSQEIAYSPRAASQVTATKPTIQGLSSLLSDRRIVLVTTVNELLDILSLEQQQEIRRRIGIDLATTWYQWQTNTTHQFDIDNELHLPQELTSNHQLLLDSQTIADTDRELRPENFFDKLRHWFGRSNARSQLVDLPLQPDIISSTEPRAPQQIAPSSYTFIPQPPKFDRYFDLPQLPPISQPDSPSHLEPEARFNPTDLIAKFQPNWLKQWWSYYRDYIYIPAEDESAIVHQPGEDFQLIPIETIPSKIKAKQPERVERISPDRSQQPQLEQTQSIARTTKSSQNLEYHQDWIEAESEPIGYSQSAFARLLAYLDRLMLRLENWIIGMFTAITDRFKIDS
jgi:hypothetical protein